MNLMKGLGNAHLSREFFDLVRSVGEAKSKQEEDRIMVSEISLLKKRFTDKNVTNATLRELLLRLLYVEMLGHDGSFGYFKAIQLSASENILQKRVGYLVSSQCLSPDHDLRFMLINQLQRDLKSPNVLEVSGALTSLCRLLTDDMLPALLPGIILLLNHENAIIRKKCVVCLHRVLQLNPEALSDHPSALETLKGFLSSQDLSLMGAAVTIFHHLLSNKARLFSMEERMQIGKTVSLNLKSLADHNAPPGLIYQQVPAPFVQIKLLRLISLLGKQKQLNSNSAAIVAENLRRNKALTTPMALSIVFECTLTLCAIVEGSDSLQIAAEASSNLLNSSNRNLRYIGIESLAVLVQKDLNFGIKHQTTVLDCLESTDDTLRRKTLTLLYRMTNSKNADFILKRLILFLRSSTDEFLKMTLISEIFELSEKFSDSEIKFCKTVFNVLETTGDLVSEKRVEDFLIWTKTVEDESVKKEAFERSLAVAKLQDSVSIQLLNVAFFCFGEFFEEGSDLDGMISLALSDRVGATGRSVFACALMKILSKVNIKRGENETLEEFIKTGLKSSHCDVYQRCRILDQLLNYDTSELSSYKPNELDLSFIHNYVDEFEEKREQVEVLVSDANVIVQDDEDFEPNTKTFDNRKAFRFEAYEKPSVPSSSFIQPTRTASTVALPKQEEKVKNVWGASGYNQNKKHDISTTDANTSLNSNSGLFSNLKIRTKPGRVQPVTETMKMPEVAFVPEVKPAPIVKPKQSTEREKMAAALFGLSSENEEDEDKSSKNFAENDKTKKPEEMDLLELDFHSPVPDKAPVGVKLKLRPLEVPIDRVGEEWGNLAAERRISINDSRNLGFAGAIALLQNEVGLKPVEVLKESNEAILAASVETEEEEENNLDDFLFGTSPTPKGRIFVHLQAREDAKAFDLIIKSSQEAMSESVVSLLQNRLS